MPFIVKNRSQAEIGDNNDDEQDFFAGIADNNIVDDKDDKITDGDNSNNENETLNTEEVNKHAAIPNIPYSDIADSVGGKTINGKDNIEYINNVELDKTVEDSSLKKEDSDGSNEAKRAKNKIDILSKIGKLGDGIKSFGHRTLDSVEENIFDKEKQVNAIESIKREIIIEIELLKEENSKLREEIDNIKNDEKNSLINDINIEEFAKLVINILLKPKEFNGDSTVSNIFTSLIVNSAKVYFQDYIENYEKILKDTLSKNVQDYQAAMENLANNINKRQNHLDGINIELDKTNIELENGRNNLVDLERQIKNENETLKNVTAATKEKEIELKERNAELESLKERINSIAESYRVEQAEIILKNTADVLKSLGVEVGSEELLKKLGL